MESYYSIKRQISYGTPYAPFIISSNPISLDNCPKCGGHRFNDNNKDISLVVEIDPTDYCPVCSKMFGEHDGNYCMDIHNIYNAKIFPDYLLCGAGPLIIISNRVLDLWQQHNVTGYSTTPIKHLYDNDRSILACHVNYYNITLTGYAELDFEKMGIEIVSHCSICGATQYNKNTWEFGSAYLKADSHDGSDLFRLRFFDKLPLCTMKITDMMQKEGLTNFEFKPFEQYFN